MIFNVKRFFAFFLLSVFVIMFPVNDVKAQIDVNATAETIALYQELLSSAGSGIRFGHQETMAYGINTNGSIWSNEDSRSDVHSVTGHYPAVMGWDFGKLEHDDPNNIDGVSFDRMRFWIGQAYDRGEIATVSWHADNPAGGSSWTSGSSTIPRILPGGDLHDSYLVWLDRLADYSQTLIGADGKLIPIIFRPYHELSGGWFWWGSSSCTPAQFIELWQMTVDYLRVNKGVHNFLYAYSTDRVYTEAAYLERYPGDNYVDVLGVDNYGDAGPLNTANFLTTVRIPASLALARNKISALTETGYERIPQNDWWTELFDALKNDDIARNISWFLVWRNAHTGHHYAPYPGHSSAANFLLMHDDPFSIFGSSTSSSSSSGSSGSSSGGSVIKVDSFGSGGGGGGGGYGMVLMAALLLLVRRLGRLLAVIRLTN